MISHLNFFAACMILEEGITQRKSQDQMLSDFIFMLQIPTFWKAMVNFSFSFHTSHTG